MMGKVLRDRRRKTRAYDNVTSFTVLAALFAAAPALAQQQTPPNEP